MLALIKNSQFKQIYLILLLKKKQKLKTEEQACNAILRIHLILIKKNKKHTYVLSDSIKQQIVHTEKWLGLQ
jgi:hypothetical protein